MRAWATITLLLLSSCEDSPGSATPDAGSCCANCGPSLPVCIHCPGQFDVCRPLTYSGGLDDRCTDLTGAELCECVGRRGVGERFDCNVIDGVARFTFNPTFCEHVADYEPGRLGACTYDPVLP